MAGAALRSTSLARVLSGVTLAGRHFESVVIPAYQPQPAMVRPTLRVIELDPVIITGESPLARDRRGLATYKGRTAHAPANIRSTVGPPAERLLDPRLHGDRWVSSDSIAIGEPLPEPTE